jgi:ssDNA-binding Zn-finger/Zn-ribbon topoisomerase 1
MADLPAYSGTGAKCPKCGRPGVTTEWHRAGGVLAPKKEAGPEPPCKSIRALETLRGEGEHLCRLCPNCGYGWAEACMDNRVGDPGRLRPVPGQGAADQ